MADFKYVVEMISSAVEAVGVLVIAIGLLFATVRFATAGLRAGEAAYRRFRHDVGRAILLGLEFLVAGDIIRTVTVDATLQNVLVLGVIVFIRTFLSVSLQVELEGRWPWRRAEHQAREA